MISIKKIAIKELESFILSDVFLAFENKPISKPRVVSYLKNPNKNNNDFALYLAFENDQIIGYRTIWRDVFFTDKGTESFGWLSGNWVHPKHRRKGVSTKIFNEVYKDWEGKLMYTNYAEESKLVYDKTNNFKKLKSLTGIRYYTRFCLADILPKKKNYLKNTSFLWNIIDGFGNFFLDAKHFFSSDKSITLEVKKDEVWNTKINLFLKKFKENELFKKQEIAFSWVKNYPWVKTDEYTKEQAKEYFFSLYSKDFISNYYTFYNNKNELVAFIWISIKNGLLKVPYCYISEESYDSVTDFINQKVKERKVKTVLIFDSKLNTNLTQKMSFVYQKKFNQKYFCTHKLLEENSEIGKKHIQSGDGDVVFT